jgi:hypothetical protein
MKPQDLDFKTWEELFDYILESKLNGQRKQSLEIYKSLSEQKQVEFLDYLIEMHEQGWMASLDLAQTIKFYEHESKN